MPEYYLIYKQLIVMPSRSLCALEQVQETLPELSYLKIKRKMINILQMKEFHRSSNAPALGRVGSRYPSSSSSRQHTPRPAQDPQLPQRACIRAMSCTACPCTFLRLARIHPCCGTAIHVLLSAQPQEKPNLPRKSEYVQMRLGVDSIH